MTIDFDNHPLLTAVHVIADKNTKKEIKIDVDFQELEKILKQLTVDARVSYIHDYDFNDINELTNNMLTINRNIRNIKHALDNFSENLLKQLALIKYMYAQNPKPTVLTSGSADRYIRAIKPNLHAMLSWPIFAIIKIRRSRNMH